MRAIQVSRTGGPEVLELRELPDPKPGPGQVLVRVRAIGVNPVETYIRSGAYAVKPQLPYVPGMDAAGVIQALGPGVHGIKEGDRVYTAGTLSGAYAESALCKTSQVHPLPENVSFAQGAAVHVPYAAAYRALFLRARARPGESVLVHGGSGGVGVAAIQLARAAGLKVIATAGTEKGLSLVAEQGAQQAFDHRAPDYAEKILAWSEGRGFDVILEMLANVNLGKDLGLLAVRGRVVVIGSRGAVEIDPRAAMGRDADILGMSLMNASEQEAASIHAALVAGLRDGVLRPIVGQELPLAQAARAHEAVMKPGAHGKIVLLPG